MKLLNFKKSLSVLPVALALLISSHGAAFAEAADKGNPGLNAAMPKLFGSNTNFIARVEAHVFDKNNQETTTMPMGFAMYGSRIRVDVNMTHIKSRDLPPEVISQMKQMGMDQMTTILLPDQKQIITIYPGLKSYALTPMEKEEVDATSKNFQMAKSRLGKETVDGHPSDKYDVILTDNKGGKQHAITWEATDLHNFPVQIQLTEDNATVIMRFKDVKLGRPEENAFKAPKGMSMFDSVNALMSDAITKKMNAGTAK